MKQVTLKSITLCNFKGEQERTTTFNPDVTTISGGNGLGKSRHFDAFIRLLFGKDAHDRKDYEIKNRVNGEELHKCECRVTGVIIADKVNRCTRATTRNVGGTKPRSMSASMTSASKPSLIHPFSR